MNEKCYICGKGKLVSKKAEVKPYGISIGKTAELLGVSKWDLMEYIGRTGIYDMGESISMNMEERIKFTRSLSK